MRVNFPDEYQILLHNPRTGIWRGESGYRRLVSFNGKLTARSIGRELGWATQSSVIASVQFESVQDLDRPSSVTVVNQKTIANWGEYEQIELRFVVNVSSEVVELAETYGLRRGFLELRLEPIPNAELVGTSYWNLDWDPSRTEPVFLRFKSLNFLPDSPHIADA